MAQPSADGMLRLQHSRFNEIVAFNSAPAWRGIRYLQYLRGEHHVGRCCGFSWAAAESYLVNSSLLDRKLLVIFRGMVVPVCVATRGNIWE